MAGRRSPDNRSNIPCKHFKSARGCKTSNCPYFHGKQKGKQKGKPAGNPHIEQVQPTSSGSKDPNSMDVDPKDLQTSFSDRTITEDMASCTHWPLSSYAVAGGETCVLAGLDESCEELRVRRWMAQISGKEDIYRKYDEQRRKEALSYRTRAIYECRSVCDAARLKQPLVMGYNTAAFPAELIPVFPPPSEPPAPSRQKALDPRLNQSRSTAVPPVAPRTSGVSPSTTKPSVTAPVAPTHLPTPNSAQSPRTVPEGWPHPNTPPPVRSLGPAPKKTSIPPPPLRNQPTSVPSTPVTPVPSSPAIAAAQPLARSTAKPQNICVELQAGPSKLLRSARATPPASSISPYTESSSSSDMVTSPTRSATSPCVPNCGPPPELGVLQNALSHIEQVYVENRTLQAKLAKVEAELEALKLQTADCEATIKRQEMELKESNYGWKKSANERNQLRDEKVAWMREKDEALEEKKAALLQATSIQQEKEKLEREMVAELQAREAELELLRSETKNADKARLVAQQRLTAVQKEKEKVEGERDSERAMLEKRLVTAQAEVLAERTGRDRLAKELQEATDVHAESQRVVAMMRTELHQAQQRALAAEVDLDAFEAYLSEMRRKRGLLPTQDKVKQEYTSVKRQRTDDDYVFRSDFTPASTPRG